MKFIKTLILLCIVLVSGTTLSIAQVPQITNGSFEQHCGNIMLACSTFSNLNNCVPGWKRTHGTPDIMTNGGFVGSKYAHMYCSYDYNWQAKVSEGMYGEYTFVSGKTYVICLAIKNNLTTTTQASLHLYGANGLTPASSVYTNACWEIPQNGSSKQLIGTSSAVYSSWTKVYFTFTPTTTCSMLYIYPVTTNNNAYQFSIDDVSITAGCSEDKIFNMSSLTTQGVIAANTYKANKMYVGSTAGGSTASGTVTTEVDKYLKFGGAQEVVFLPNFQSTIGQFGIGEIVAKIEPCDNGYDCNTFSAKWENNNAPYEHESEENVIMDKAIGYYLKVSPNPFTDYLRLEITSRDEQITSVVEATKVLVFDRVGHEVHSENIQLVDGKFVGNINLQNLKPGVYSVRVTVGNKTFIENVVKAY